jgi:hypothetical protein
MAGKPRLVDPNELLLAARQHTSRIRWPGARQLQEVSLKLARVVRIGRRAEAKGDYFKSGDLAYEIQQIILAAEDLLKKGQRSQR